MLIDQDVLVLAVDLPRRVGALPRPDDPSVNDDGQPGVRSVHGVPDLREVSEVLRAEVLVADADVVQRERLRVAGGRAEGGPVVRGRVAGRPLEEVEGVLDHGGELGALQRQVLVLPGLAAVAGPHHGDGRHSQVLAEQEVLVEADLVALAVVAVRT